MSNTHPGVPTLLSVQQVEEYREDCKRTVAPPYCSKQLEAFITCMRSEDPTYVFDPSRRFDSRLSPGLRDLYVQSHLDHMVLGIAGEYFEYAHLGDPPLEELGDLCWYGFNLTSCLGIETQSVRQAMFSPSAVPLAQAVEGLVNQTKRYNHYGLRESKHAESLRSAALVFIASLITEIKIENVEQVWEANRRKLFKGEKARYQSGEFSTGAAEERADKA